MKLVFPGGEHAPVELTQGATSIGSSGACTVTLHGPGVAAAHCEVRLNEGRASVRPLDVTAPTVLNGRQVSDETAIGDGDLLVLGRVGCTIAASARSTPPPPRARAAAVDDGRTRVRATLPKFMLRGVSGATLGKTFAITDNAVIGRQADCDIALTAEEVSRHHARLKITADGIHVEDMGSANGTFINGKRVSSALLRPGEELRLDTVRFLLVTPGMDARQQSAGARKEPPPATGSTAPQRRSNALWIVIGTLAIAAVAYLALRYAGVI